MLWFFIGHVFSIRLSLIHVSHLSENNKDLEIIILRHQLNVMVRKQNMPVRSSRVRSAYLLPLAQTSRAVWDINDTGKTVLHPRTLTFDCGDCENWRLRVNAPTFGLAAGRTSILCCLGNGRINERWELIEVLLIDSSAELAERPADYLAPLA